MHKTYTLLRHRRWLRPNSSWGPQTSIHSQVTLEDYTDEETHRQSRSLYGDFGLRDCGEYVSVDLNASTEKHYKQHLKALTVLLDEVQAVTTAWIEAGEQVKKLGGWEVLNESKEHE
jgi:hypothetical protein